ncbi:hypothetical protein WJX72_000407 [[Myrmecia] bisecta]|uniref:Tyrosyl-DNA phosphodiesterase 1 n=1 Tax=[Myrmecia] bisecta TaxID=41462 RepID=A0AAW1PPB6_9CHLO
MASAVCLQCPDGSVAKLDATKTVIGRGSAVGGLQDSFVSRQQLAVQLVRSSEGGLYAEVENLGLNPLVVERRARSTGRQAGGDWEVAEVLQQCQTGCILPGDRFHVATRKDTTTFQVLSQDDAARNSNLENPIAAGTAHASGAHIPEPEMAVYVARQRERHTAAAQAGATASSSSDAQKRILPPLSLLNVRDPGMPDWANTGMLGARLRDIIQGNIKWILISNYMIDLPWLLSACPALLGAQQAVIVHGERGGRPAEWRQDPRCRQFLRTTTVHAPRLPEQWGTYHSKAFLIEYATGLRVVVHTANLIYPDCNCKSQGVWVQDFPCKDEAAKAAPPAEFEAALADYLRALELPEASEQHALALCASHDFSSARAHLVPSIPGKHGGPRLNRYGHLRVRDLLGREAFDDSFQHAPIAAQFSSLGSLDEKWLLNEFRLSLAAGTCSADKKLGLPAVGPTGLQLVWPMVAEVRDSGEGWYAGGSIPGSHKNVTKAFLQPYWHRWGGQPVGRQRAMPHIKTYTRYVPGREGKGDGTLAYFLLTSHNLSKAAWGSLTNGIQGRFLHVSSLTSDHCNTSRLKFAENTICRTASASRATQQLAVQLVQSSEGGLYAEVENLGLYPLVVERRTRLTGRQAGGCIPDLCLSTTSASSTVLDAPAGGDWEVAQVLQKCQTARISPGGRFHVATRKETTTFQCRLEQPLAAAVMRRNVSCLHFPLLRVRDPGMPDWANTGVLGARLRDIIQGNIKWILISNYLIDLPWFLNTCPALLGAQQAVIVHGERGGRPARWRQDPRYHQFLRTTTVHAPRLPEQWGTYHSKAFLFEYATGLRVVVHTTNLIHLDCNRKSEGVWVQDFPRKDEAAKAAPPAEFEAALADYLRALELPEASEQHALALCASHDFSSARAHLVPSIPGEHGGPRLNQYGHLRVRDLLGREAFDDSFQHAPIAAQFSSLGSLDEKWLPNEFRGSLSAGTCSAGKDQKLGLPAVGPAGLQLVWPMVAEPYWHRWGGQPVGRQYAMPHIKTYMRYVPGRAGKADGTLAYFLLTSHNLSKAAWGSLTNGIQGRFLYGGSGKSDQLNVMLPVPYKLPPIKYSPGDVPWNVTENHQELRWGRLSIAWTLLEVTSLLTPAQKLLRFNIKTPAVLVAARGRVYASRDATPVGSSLPAVVPC